MELVGSVGLVVEAVIEAEVVVIAREAVEVGGCQRGCSCWAGGQRGQRVSFIIAVRDPVRWLKRRSHAA